MKGEGSVTFWQLKVLLIVQKAHFVRALDKTFCLAQQFKIKMTDYEKFRSKVGSDFQLQWPQLSGVLSITSTDLVQDLLSKDPIVTVTEKLDGSNLCLSSGSWIASRRRVILDNPSQHDLDKYMFCGVSLSSIGQLMPKLKLIAQDLKSYFMDRDFEVMLYGEWIQKVEKCFIWYSKSVGCVSCSRNDVSFVLFL